MFGPAGTMHPSTLRPGDVVADEEIEGEVWRSRTKVTVGKERWLLTLAQVHVIPPDRRDSFILNLALVSYPFGQYLLQYVSDLSIAETAFVASGTQYATVDEDRAAWREKFTREHEKRRAVVQELMEDKYPAGWKVWESGWGVEEVEAALRGGREGEREGEGQEVTRVGVYANRPFPQSDSGGNEEERQTLKRELIAFQAETTVLSLLDRVRDAKEGDDASGSGNAALDRFTLLVHLCLVLTRCPAPITRALTLQGVLTRVQDEIRRAGQALDPLEKEWLELDADAAWDVQEVCKGLKEVGVGGEGCGPGQSVSGCERSSE